jgi:hypothetical protein
MPKGKTKKVKNRNTAGNRQRRIKGEIRKCQRKLDKLLKLHEEGKQRWTYDRKGNRVDLKIARTQGIISGSKRHTNLSAHIERLKSQVV